MPERVELRILRQDAPGAPQRWEEFSVPYYPNMNVISALMEIRRHPVTKQGQRTTPVVWDANCLEEVCGACTMIISGQVRQSCSALVDKLQQPIVLAPMTKFPVVRDLWVDRSRMFETLKRVKAWIPIDGTYDLGPGPRQNERERQAAYHFSRCMTCGCCLEACPQFQKDNHFVGPAALGQVRLFNAHPTGRLNADERLEAILGDGGLADCGNAQNCVKVCPKEIPLTQAIAELGRQTTGYIVRKLLGS